MLSSANPISWNSPRSRIAVSMMPSCPYKRPLSWKAIALDGVTLGDQACPKELAKMATRFGGGLECCKATLLFVNVIAQFCNRNWLAKIAQHHLKRRRTKYGTEQKTVSEHWAPSIYI